MTNKAPERPVEPSDIERAELPNATQEYLEYLEAVEDHLKAAVAAERLPRPKDASTWELDPSFVMKVTHDINRGGWEATMEVVEMAMLAAERALLDKEPGQ